MTDLLQGDFGNGRDNSKRLELLLAKLEQKDRLYEYNIPPTIKDFPESKLMDYLEEKYKDDNFVITNPEAIKKYAQSGDIVVKNGDYKEVNWRVKTGSKGKVKKVFENSLEIKFPNCRVKLRESDQLIVYGDGRFFGHDLVEEKPVTSIAVIKGYMVRYEGHPIESVKTFVPDGTKGVITAEYKGQYFITWVNTPNLKFEYPKNPCANHPDHSKPEKYFPAEDFKLIIPNGIDLSELVQEVGKELLREQEG